MSSFAKKQRKIKEKAVQEAIYEATIRLIAKNDGEGLKMQEIAEAAGIATGTLYNYFKNKVELLYFVDRQLHILILSRFKDIAYSTCCPTEKLENLIGEVLGFCRDYHGVFDLAERFGVKDQIPKEEKSGNLADAYRCIQHILDEGIANKQFRQLDTAQTAEMFFASMIGITEVQDWLKEYDMPTQAKKLKQFFLDYLNIQ